MTILTYANRLAWLATIRGMALVAVSISLVWGLCMPEFYEWTGSDQSRPASIVSYTALSMIALNFVLMGVLGFDYRRRQSSESLKAIDGDRPTRQLSIWHLMFVTLLVALLLALAKMFSITVAAIILNAAAWVYCALLLVLHSDKRLHIICLIACQWLPFSWILRDKVFVSIAGDSSIAALPGLLPAALAAQWFQLARENWSDIAIVFTACSFAVGLIMVRWGARRALIAMVALFTLSIFNSFVLQALIRA